MKLAGPKLLLLAFAACLLSAPAAARAQNHAPVVKSVEPPSWWAGHTVNPVRLLVRGEYLQHSTVRAPEGSPLAVVGYSANKGGTYLILDLRIDPAARPGDYELYFTNTARREVKFRVEAPLDPSKTFQGVTTDDVIYLIMPDRFADGDPSNNNPAGSPPEANDRANPRGWHGGDFRGITRRLPYLKELGVTAVWLTPWYDNWNGVNTCDKPWCPNTYYHGYHAVDYYAVEDRFGTMETLREMVEKAHALGLKVIQDQVANHVGAQHPWVKDPPLADWFHGTLASTSATPSAATSCSRRTRPPRRAAPRSTAGSPTTCPT